MHIGLFMCYAICIRLNTVYMLIAYMVKEIYFMKRITKMGDRYIVNIPMEYVQILKKNGMLGDQAVKITFERS